MHSPLSMQALAHFSDSAGPAPRRTMPNTPATTSFGSASPRPAGPAIGQAVKQAPHPVQALSISLTRPSSAASNPELSMAGDRNSVPTEASNPMLGAFQAG